MYFKNKLLRGLFFLEKLGGVGTVSFGYLPGLPQEHVSVKLYPVLHC